jgi:hypothetical protein
VTERVGYWKSNGDSLDAVYYLYVFYSLQAISGSVLAVDKALRALEECRNRTRFRRYRTWSYEWLGLGKGLKQLVHQEQLGEWDRGADFWKDATLLRRIEGVVSFISGPQAGEIEFAGGLKAFFVPGVAGLSAARSENIAVSFLLGFSYDGPRAWSVEQVS